MRRVQGYAGLERGPPDENMLYAICCPAQDPPLRLFVDSYHQEVVSLPQFENEMLDIDIDPEAPAIKTDFLLFRQRQC